MCGGAGSSDGSTSIAPCGCAGPRLVLLCGGRRELSIPLCCQELSSWAYISEPSGEGLEPMSSPGASLAFWRCSASAGVCAGAEIPFTCPFGRLVGHQVLGCEEEKLKEGLGVSSTALGTACPLHRCFGEYWVTLLSLAGCMKEMKTSVLFSLPRAAEWPCFIVVIDFDLTTSLTMQLSLASGCF